MTVARTSLAERARRQARACGQLGSPLYATLLERVAEDIEAGGPAWDVMCDQRLASGSAPTLRLMGAMHRLVLEGRAPALTRHYPTTADGGGGPGAGSGDPWPGFRAALQTHRAALRERVDDPVQTNEVGRAGALICGLAVVVRETGLPLRLLELGASAGLNLNLDRFAYEVRPGGDVVGDPASPVRIVLESAGTRPPLDTIPAVVDRAGCDARPVDATTASGRLTLLSYVWPDQAERVRLLEGAIELAHRAPTAVDERSAAAWVRGHLAGERPGVATVVCHSILVQYLDPSEREDLDGVLAEAGRRADERAPLARLSMEPAGERADVRLIMWPGGEERLLARAGYHGRPVQWLAGAGLGVSR